MPRVLLLGIALLLASCGMRSEDSLRNLFSVHKEVVLKLLAMQKQDEKLVRIAPSFTRLDTDWSWPRTNIGLSTERWDEYRHLFAEAGITDGIQKDGQYIWYFVSSQGLAIAGMSRGFVYTEEVAQPIVANFEQCPHTEGVCFIKIEKGWFLFQWQT